MLHCYSGSSASGEELSAEVPGQGLDRPASLENLGYRAVSLLSQVEDGDHGLSLGCGREPVAILGEADGLDRGAEAERGSLLEGVGHEELDFT